MKIAFGCDPDTAGLKLALIAKAQQLGHEVKDFGVEDPIYANTAVTMARAVAAREFDRGVLAYGTGIEVSIAADRVKGTYCACVTDIYRAQRATLSNDADLIAMGSQVVGVRSVEMFLEEYLKYTPGPTSRSEAKAARICEFKHED